MLHYKLLLVPINPSKWKVDNMYILKFTIERIKQDPTTCSRLSSEEWNNVKNSKLVPEPHSWPTSSSLLGAFFRPQTTFFNTIPVVQVYLKSTKWIEIKSSGLVERRGGSRSEDLGVNPDFVLLELHDLEQLFNSLNLNCPHVSKNKTTNLKNVL